MEEAPKVSVIIPVYNTEQYLRQCLDSVVNQTLREIEIICVDDGSTDGSPAILQEYGKRDGRVMVLAQGRKGAGAARNRGLKAAKGEYLSFLDADDFFDRNMLRDCYEKAKAETSDIVVYAANQYHEKTKQVTFLSYSLQEKNCPGHSPFSPEEMADRLFNSFQNWTWNKLFRREMVERRGIRFQEIARTNDMAFVAQALAQAEWISTLPFPYACYRVAAGGSLQSTNDRSPLCFWEAYQETKRRLEGCGLYQKYEKSFLNAVLEGTCYNLGSVKSQKSYDQICRCIREGWERDFHFSSHPPRYYQNSFQYRELRRIAEGKGSGKHRGLFVLLARGADCLRKNGWRYTWKRALSALGRG